MLIVDTPLLEITIREKFSLLQRKVEYVWAGKHFLLAKGLLQISLSRVRGKPVGAGKRGFSAA